MWIRRKDFDRLTDSNARLKRSFDEMQKISMEWQRRYQELKKETGQ